MLLIDQLFGVDAEARAQNCDWAARDALRQQQSRPLLDTIQKAIEAARGQALPSSKLGNAIGYAQTLWAKLTRFLDYPELELSNNLAENSMRPVALGRKNWIHIGSPQAGPKVAAILSVVETCRRLKIPVRQTWPLFCPGWPMSVSSAWPNSLPLLGLDGISNPGQPSSRRVGLTLTDKSPI